MSYHRIPSRLAVRQCLSLLASIWLLSLTVFGQAKPAQNTTPDPLAPVYVTTRIFQLSAKKGSYPEVSDQVFRLKSAGLIDEDKWLTAFKKTYPELTPALLQTSSLRVFRTSKPGIITFGEQDGRSLRIQLFAAQSPGDGTIPGTTLIPEIGMHAANGGTPMSLSMQPLEIETGMTYYFAAPRLKLSDQDYADFIRKGAPATTFAAEDHFIVFAFSVDLERPKQTSRVLTEQQSATLLAEAKKKVQPELATTVKKAGLSGQVRVRVEIAPDGKVIRALTQSSTLPEMNSIAITAARQWEFSPALFAENKDPISGLLTFDFAAETKTTEPKQPSSN